MIDRESVRLVVLMKISICDNSVHDVIIIIYMMCLRPYCRIISIKRARERSVCLLLGMRGEQTGIMFVCSKIT